ncbi:hypothetical protein TIFTF001_040203 [Ficus carica]|uniref:Uncharacterized protein n=1 Tax=Ficus carica TaxID=3494 RepID=A0AA87YZP1_FICCA|nr:hypothetical protein TIFTF001_040203 [Ficus carica]
MLRKPLTSPTSSSRGTRKPTAAAGPSLPATTLTALMRSKLRTWTAILWDQSRQKSVTFHNIVRDSVLTGSSSTSDTANANKVSNLREVHDTRWWSVAGRTDAESIELGLNWSYRPIPRSIGSLPQLHLLNLSYNQISGPTPGSFKSGNLAMVDLKSKKLDGDMTRHCRVSKSATIGFLGGSRGGWPTSSYCLTWICELQQTMQGDSAGRQLAILRPIGLLPQQLLVR